MIHPLLFLILLLPNLAWGADAPVPVTLTPLQSLWFLPEYSDPAEVKALNRARLAAEINARIEQIAVREGDRVEAGTLLVALDCRDHRARLRQQQAELERLQAQSLQAQQRLQRARNLLKQKNIAEEEIEARNTELDSLSAQMRAQQAAIEQQQRNVERCQLSAPFAGQVVARLAAEAELASPGTPLIELLQLDSVELEAEVRPDSLNGDEALKMRFLYLDRSYPVELARRFHSINPDSGTLRLRLRFTGPTPPPGAAGRLLRQQPQQHLPADYLQRRNDQLGVFLHREGKAEFHPLAGAIEGRPAAIDLPADSMIIDQGRHGLEHGDSLSLVGE